MSTVELAASWEVCFQCCRKLWLLLLQEIVVVESQQLRGFDASAEVFHLGFGQVGERPRGFAVLCSLLHHLVTHRLHVLADVLPCGVLVRLRALGTAALSPRW